MGAKTDYNPDGYNRESFANIMQFVFADLMIRHDREGPESFFQTNEEVAALRKRIEKAYNLQRVRRGETYVPVQRLGEAVLLWLREGATVQAVLKASNLALIKRARKLMG